MYATERQVRRASRMLVRVVLLLLYHGIPTAHWGAYVPTCACANYHAALSSLSLLYLNGSSPQPVPKQLVEVASKLYSVLHHTGGKVGAATQWRKSMDDTVAFARGALQSIRTTFPVERGRRITHAGSLESF